MIQFTAVEHEREILAGHAARTDQQGRPAPESLTAARKAGAFGLRTPASYGGAGAGAVHVARHLAELGRACPATAWIAGTCATGKTLAARTFGDEALRDLYADPDALVCGVGFPGGRAERAAGGVRVTGRWPNASGCEDASWAVLAVRDGDTVALALIPVTDLTIDRTWRMAGMRGTGSHTLVAERVPVPAARLVPVPQPADPADRLLIQLTVLGPVVGAARGALDVVAAMFGSDRKPFMSAHQRMGDSPGARLWLADATRLVDRAERTMLALAATADAGELTGADGPRLQTDLADAARDCRAALDLMLDLHGASGFATTNALQRHWRDVAVGSRHPHLNPYLAAENYGRALVPAR
ncbi:acyl-CoA dehydrogenase family protein [Actinoplanes utahensis]|uniref:Acyl-CoA dehydrogenase n=1 Tax=Actinoplanes utahensis TaxID=1869 RepID=A0A0A6UP49_ACTUT|nr:acyl-CoA dehydrogenase family protein [Actinoplanes utahensis]KHD77915.1 acyl-CoA dehydrogenase [Actinoplanes utahensis]